MINISQNESVVFSIILGEKECVSKKKCRKIILCLFLILIYTTAIRDLPMSSQNAGEPENSQQRNQ